ncbi:MAG: NADH-quinone oxidoreductase subunit NuoE [Deltaproteobacteria bacterium]|nr:NADH-quinone oxidoreductase subunit NuoE [Deltaproteobacteria bacterium]
MTRTKKTTKADLKKIDAIIGNYRGQRWGLIPLLHDVQMAVGYIPPEAMPRIASGLGMFPSQVQGVISFYTQFYTEPRGKNIVRVCRGTACHVRGGKTILKLVKRELGLEEGETSPDMEYTLETVACIGVCALAPNIVINQETHGDLNPKKVARLFEGKRKK